MRIVFLGLSITSSWGNGHATTYRGLVRELVARGHEVLFLEADRPWYAARRDLPVPPWGRTALYEDLTHLREEHALSVRDADVVIVGSFVPDGVAVGNWVLETARGTVGFYDIDTPVTLAALERDACSYLTREQVARYALYLSFTGGPTLNSIERAFGSPRARPLHCSVDPQLHAPRPVETCWSLGYLGTYSEDRQATLQSLLLEPAGALDDRFVVAGPQYPRHLEWPSNVERLEHVAPNEHPAFYSMQRFTLNVTRADMRRAGWSPSVRLFEAAACGVPVITDEWSGLADYFEPGLEILTAREGADVVRILGTVDEQQRRLMGERARARVLRQHTAAHRALELEQHLDEAMT